MSKKKQQKNGFFYYMLDLQQDFKQQGRSVPMRDMSIFAGPSWSKLSDAQKLRYNMRAKGNPNGSGATAGAAVSSNGKHGRRDCAGNLVTVSEELASSPAWPFRKGPGTRLVRNMSTIFIRG